MKKHSVKNRNRRIRQKYQPPRSVASDTYTNPPAFLGAASNLISSGTWIRSGLASNTDLLTTLYRESWLAKRIIDMPVEDMTRPGIPSLPPPPRRSKMPSAPGGDPRRFRPPLQGEQHGPDL